MRLMNVGHLVRWTRMLWLCAVWSWLASPLSASAQGATWTSLGPPGGTVLSLVASPSSSSVLYAGTSVNGVFMSADGGQSWSAANTGLTPTASSASRTVRALAADSQYVYAATDAGLFYAAAGLTGNDLPNWAPITKPNGLVGTFSLLIVDATSKMLLAATSAADSSSAPAVYAMPLPAPTVAPSGSWVASPMPSDTMGSGIGAVTVFPGVAVFAAVADRVFVASVVGANSPMSWVDDDPAPQLRGTVIESIHFAADFSQVYACSGGQLLMATSALDPPNNRWNQLTVTPTPTVSFSCAGMTSGGLAFGTPPPGGTASAVAVATSVGVYVSTDGFLFAATQALGVSPVADTVAMVGGATPMLFVGAGFGVASQPLWTLAPATAWTANNGPAAIGNARLNNASVSARAVIDTTLYAAVAAEQYADVLASTDAGVTWTSTGLKDVIPDLVDIPVLAVDASNRVVYAGTSVGLYALAGGTWLQIAAATVTEVNSLVVAGSTLFVGTENGLYGLALSATPSSSTLTPAGLTGMAVSALHAASGNLYAGVFDTAQGLASVSVAAATSSPSWADFAGLVGTHRVQSLLWTGSVLLAASRVELVSFASPGGSWSSASTGLSDPSNRVSSLVSDGSTIYAATGSNGVFTSLASVLPLTWTPYNGSGADALPSLEVHKLRIDGNAVYAATAGGLAAIGAVVVGPTPPSPPPTGGGSSGGGGSGGGAIDVASLLALLSFAALLFATRQRRRPGH